MENEMRYLYVLLMYLPSGFGRLTQRVTHYKYTHVALSLDDRYKHFYAFSRLRAKTPPISGYIEEKRIYYTLGENVPIYVKIFKVPVSEKGYRRAKRWIEKVRNDPEIMYNLIQMLLLPWLGGHPVYKAYNCGEFIAKILKKAGVPLDMPYYKYMPRDFARLLKDYEIFEGTLKNDSSEGMEDDFFRETGRWEYFSKTAYIVRELLYRQLTGHASRNFKPEKVRFVQ